MGGHNRGGHNRKEIEYTKTASGCWECTSHRLDANGYPRIRRGNFSGKLSRYMYLTYKGPINECLVIRHKCDNLLCINPDHLELGTQAENVHDMDERGRRNNQVGSTNGRAKLTGNDVRNILKRLRKGESRKALRFEFGISKSQINKIANRQFWKNVDESVCEQCAENK